MSFSSIEYITSSLNPISPITKNIDIFNEEDAKIFDEINRDTENRINFEIRDNTYFKTLKNSIKKKVHYLISYIDCD